MEILLLDKVFHCITGTRTNKPFTTTMSPNHGGNLKCVCDDDVTSFCVQSTLSQAYINSRYYMFLHGLSYLVSPSNGKSAIGAS
jgi:hypothetical protein